MEGNCAFQGSRPAISPHLVPLHDCWSPYVLEKLLILPRCPSLALGRTSTGIGKGQTQPHLKGRHLTGGRKDWKRWERPTWCATSLCTEHLAGVLVRKQKARGP